jgi:5-methylcytosine-specific restriction endonuclease McrA
MADSQSITSRACLVCGKLFTDKKPSRLAKRIVCSRACSTIYQQGENNPHWKGGSVEVPCHRCGKTKKVYPCNRDKVHYCSRKCLAIDQSEAFKGENGPRWNGGPTRKIKYCPRCGKPGVPNRKRYHEECLSRNMKTVCEHKLCKKCAKPGVVQGRRYHAECSPRLIKKHKVVQCIDCGIERKLQERKGVYQKRCMSCDIKRRKGKGNSNWKGGITPKNQKIRASERYKEWRKAVFERDQFTCIWCGQVGGTLHADHIKPFSEHPRLRFKVSNGRTLCVACHKKTSTFLSKGKKRRPKLKQLDLGLSQ